MGFVNLTPHAITICDGVGEIVISIEPSGSVLRAQEIVDDGGSIDGVSVVNTKFGPLEGADITPQEGVTFIVSPFCGGHPALAGRTDVVCPDTGPTSCVRDDAGRIKGVKRLRRFRQPTRF